MIQVASTVTTTCKEQSNQKGNHKNKPTMQT